MEQLFDLDKLHKKQRRKTIRNSFVGVLVLAVLVAAGVSALGHKKPASHSATVSGDFTAGSQATPQSTQNTSNTDSGSLSPATAKVSTPNITMPSYSTPTYTPYTAPGTPSSSTPTYSYTPSSNTGSTYTPPSCPQLASYEQQLTTAQNKLNTDETYAQEGVNPGLYGVSGSGIQAYWNTQIAQDQQNVNTAQQQLNAYKQQNPGC